MYCVKIEDSTIFRIQAKFSRKKLCSEEIQKKTGKIDKALRIEI